MVNLLVLTSRYTANRDIIGEDFGRQTRLFEAFTKLGNKVDFFVADYKKLERKNLKLHDMNITIEPFKPIRFYSFYKKLKSHLKKNNYNYLFVTSDPLWSVFAYKLSKKYKIPIIYDIQDDFSIFKTWKTPILGFIVRHYHYKTLKKAHLVTCASDILSNDQRKWRKNGIITIPNGVDINLFKPIDKQKSRQKLKLPKKVKIISYIGSLQKQQGVDILIKAFENLKKKHKNLNLMLVGKPSAHEKKDLKIKQERMIYLGSIDQKKVPYAINASDVLVMPYPLNTFTRVMQAPYKLVEFMACNRPVVVTDVGDLPKMINNKKLVAKHDDIKSLSKTIENALKIKKVKTRDKAMKYSWDEIAKKLEYGLE